MTLRPTPLELCNLAGSESTRETEDTLRKALEVWMIHESDFLPLPTHALQTTVKKKTD